MSSPMLPISGPFGPSDLTPPGAGDASPASFTADLDRAHGRPPSIGAARIGPPPEVLEEMAGAAERFDELRRAGYEVTFVGSQGHGTSIELRDPRGDVRLLSISEAVEIAAGRSAR
jgi:hypothetical protein